MITKYYGHVDKETVIKNLHRLIGQVYKLLPYREEGIDWMKPLATIQNELAGMNSLFADYEEFNTNLFSLECKLEGLIAGNAKDDFELFRGDIFACIGKIKGLEDLLCQDSTI